MVLKEYYCIAKSAKIWLFKVFFFLPELIWISFESLFFFHINNLGAYFLLLTLLANFKLLPILHSKKTTKREEGVKNSQFWDDIVYGRPPSVCPFHGNLTIHITISCTVIQRWFLERKGFLDTPCKMLRSEILLSVILSTVTFLLENSFLC